MDRSNTVTIVRLVHLQIVLVLIIALTVAFVAHRAVTHFMLTVPFTLLSR